MADKELNSNGGSTEYDYLIVGSGSGAFASAIAASDLGKSVLMVERGVTGGTCVNIGCVPSKALLADSTKSNGSRSLADAVARKDELVGSLRQKKYVDLLDEYGIEFRQGTAAMVDRHTVDIEGTIVSASAVLIATGARPAVPAIEGLEAVGYLTSTDALDVTEPPDRLVVLGANAVGLELGQMFGNFGSRVTFIARRTVAPYEEPEISSALRETLEGQGHEVLEGANTDSVAVEGGEKILRGHFKDGDEFEVRADEILVSTGRVPNVEELGLEKAGVETDEGGAIVVDSEQRTNIDSIFAVGDVTTQPRYVYVAAAGGAAAAVNALDGGNKKLDFSALPRIIFTSPAVARAGLTEAEAREQGIEVETSVLTLDAVPRALVNGDTNGLIKLVADSESGQLVGASVFADGAEDVIQSAVLAIGREMTVDEIAASWAPYLAMAEGLKLAAQIFSRDVSKLSCCAA